MSASQVLELLRILAWPVAVIVVAFILRRSIYRLW